jgi:hypothetical protein
MKGEASTDVSVRAADDEIPIVNLSGLFEFEKFIVTDGNTKWYKCD